MPTERICAVLAAKRAIREALRTITVGNGYTATVTWTDDPAGQNQPITPPDPQGADALTVCGELAAENGEPNPELGNVDRDQVTMAVTLSLAVSDATAMTADDYLDQLQADVQTAVMADVTQGGQVFNTQYQGWEKLQSIDGTMLAVKVKFGVWVQYPQDRPYGEE